MRVAFRYFVCRLVFLAEKSCFQPRSHKAKSIRAQAEQKKIVFLLRVIISVAAVHTAVVAWWHSGIPGSGCMIRVEHLTSEYLKLLRILCTILYQRNTWYPTLSPYKLIGRTLTRSLISFLHPSQAQGARDLYVNVVALLVCTCVQSNTQKPNLFPSSTHTLVISCCNTDSGSRDTRSCNGIKHTRIRARQTVVGSSGRFMAWLSIAWA